MAKKLSFDILEEMIAEILILLPVKSVLICKSVCKQWLFIISNPSFIKSHLRRAIIASRNNPTLLALEDGSPPPSVAFPLIQLCGEDLVAIRGYEEDNPQHQRHRQLVNEARLDTNAQDLSNSPLHYVLPRLFVYNHHKVINSYNGIICLANIGFFHNIYLWNPSIRKCKKLPAPPPHTSVCFRCKLGFGYDSISDDYKVVRFVYDLDDQVMIAQVYSTNGDSWRAFQEPLLNNQNIYKINNIVVDGVMYFDGGDELISFDLHKEVFGLIPFPSFIQRKGSYVLDFEGSVAMVFESGQGIHLWTLDDVSGQMSWTKKFSIPWTKKFSIPWTKKFSIHPDLENETETLLYCYLGCGQFYGKKFFNGYYLYDILYDYQKRETKYYRLEEQNLYANVKYTETLVSLDGFEHVE